MARRFARSLLILVALVELGALDACMTNATTSSGTSAGTSTGGIAGSWSTASGSPTSLQLNLQSSGTSLSGSGVLTVPALAPVSGPATPAYTGDSFTLTGSDSSPTVTFTGPLGANPTGTGGFYYGTLSFNGTLTNGALTGTVTFTPPRTASQVWAAQTINGVTLSMQ